MFLDLLFLAASSYKLGANSELQITRDHPISRSRFTLHAQVIYPNWFALNDHGRA
jgi:hypothetical protein